MTECYSACRIIGGDGPCPLVVIVLLLVALVGIAVLYLYRERLKEPSPYVYYGLIGVMLLVALFAVYLNTSTCTTPSSSPFAIEQSPGVVDIITVYAGSDSVPVGIVGPDGTNSTKMEVDIGTRTTLRSNEKVISYLNNPGINITVPTTSGTKTVESVGELPSEYQKAPDGLIDPDANIDNYDNASVATAACLVLHSGIKIGEKRVPANVTLPCNTPVLAQNDSVTPGTSVKPSSGPNAGKTLTSPVTLRSGEYQIIGTVDGEQAVLRRIRVSDEVAQE